MPISIATVALATSAGPPFNTIVEATTSRHLDRCPIQKQLEQIERHPVVRRADDHELRALSRVRSAPEALSRAAITWARSVRRDQSTTGADPDVAEALHLAVGTTRWGCQMAGGQGPWSREAFALLHDRWGTTTWAARTPYWFDAVSGGLTPLPSRSR